MSKLIKELENRKKVINKRINKYRKEREVIQAQLKELRIKAFKDRNLATNDVEVYEFIKTYINKNRFSPSLQEIVNNSSLKSKSGASLILERLEAKGYIERPVNARRVIKITAH